MKLAQDNMRRHALLDEQSRERLPALYSQDGKGDQATAQVKLFCPYGRMTLYVTEFDGDDTLFGYMVSPLGPDCDEWGYASLEELAEAKFLDAVPAIERDLYWEPVTVREALLA